MKQFVPDYYHRFACIKGACRHSCCIGWEIDIDEATLARYRDMSGPMGEKLKKNIVEAEGCASFRLSVDERCPFLDASGLCELILNLGEDSLCQICADHPRFRSFFSDREETGLALCCEAAGKLILTNPGRVKYICISDDGGEDSLSEEEQDLLDLRSELLSLLQDRKLSVKKRLARMLESCGLQAEFDLAEWAEFLLKLERLDEAWTQRLQELASLPEDLPPLPDSPEWEIAFEQLLVYLMMRHLPGALEDNCTAERILFSALVFEILQAMLKAQACEGKITIDDFIEIARLYSSEIEYSDENTGAILDETAARLL